MSQSLTRYLDMSAPYDLPVEQSERKSPKPQLPPEEIAETWLDHFNKAIMTRNASAITHLFHSDGIVPSLFHIDLRMVEGCSRSFLG